MHKPETHSPVELQTYQVMGRKLRINFNHQTKEVITEDGGNASTHVYTTACVDKLADRGTIIEAIMKTRYPTYGAELAAIQNGGADASDHQEMRELAKQLADGWVNK